MNPICSRSNFPQIVLLSTMVISHAASLSAADSRDWPVYLGDKANSHFSELSLIHTGNVQRLDVAWTYHSADARADRSQIQCNPLIVDGVLYGTSPEVNLF